MLGHRGQTQDEFVFDELEQIKTRRTDYPLGFIVFVTVKFGRAPYDLEAVFYLHGKNKGLQTALALERNRCCRLYLNKPFSGGRTLALHRPLHLRTDLLLRQTRNQPAKIDKAVLARSLLNLALRTPVGSK